MKCANNHKCANSHICANTAPSNVQTTAFVQTWCRQMCKDLILTWNFQTFHKMCKSLFWISIGNKASFCLLDVNFPHWLQAQEKMSQIRTWKAFVLIHSMQTQWWSFNVHSCRNFQNLKQIFKRMHYNRKMKDSFATKSYPQKLYTPLLCTTKIIMSSVNLVKSY